MTDISVRPIGVMRGVPGSMQGPGVSVDNDVVLFSGTTGALVKDSGVLISQLALLVSPTFTGDPKAPTAAPGDADTSIANTAFVAAGLALKANLASPTFTGDPKAPTPAPGDNDTSIATSAFVAAAIAAIPAAPWPLGTLNGLTISRASATTFGVATGNCRNDDGGTGFNMLLASAFTKSLSAWAVGTGNGGLDTGAVAASTWYHVHLIRKTSDGSLDVLYSLSPTAPTMPSGYVARCYLNSFKTDGASQITAFIQIGDDTLWDAAVIDVDATNPGTAAVTRVLSTPLGVKTLALLSVGAYFGTNNFGLVVSSLAVSDQAPQVPATAALTGFSTASGISGGTAHWDFFYNAVITDTASSVRSRISASGAADHIGIITRGWRRIRSQ